MKKQPWWKGSRGEWYVIIQFFIFGLIAVAPVLTGEYPSWDTPGAIVSFVIGSILGILGLILAFAGLFHLGENLTALPHPKEESTMVETGAYSIVRHPIYSGLIIGAFGWALFWGSLLTLIYAIILLIFFDIKSRREERWLVDKFPDYVSYQNRVRKLIPFIY